MTNVATDNCLPKILVIMTFEVINDIPGHDSIIYTGSRLDTGRWGNGIYSNTSDWGINKGSETLIIAPFLNWNFLHSAKQ